MLSLLLALTLQTNSNPNLNKAPEPGWGAWRQKAEITKAGFDSGFSNMELGGYLDFQNFCTTKIGLPDEKIDYWFRLSNSVNRIGTGIVEFGCWYNGKFVDTYKITAITTKLTNVDCLRVHTPHRRKLIIRAEPKSDAKQLGTVRNGRTVKVDNFPAEILEVNGENWIHIVSPTQGWVSDGSFAGSGNLRLCKTD